MKNVIKDWHKTGSMAKDSNGFAKSVEIVPWTVVFRSLQKSERSLFLTYINLFNYKFVA